MLEKIININTNHSYKGSKKSSSHEKFLKKPYIQKEFGKDSIIFSPAALYLSKINWHLKDIEFPASDKITISFFIYDYEFQTEIDLMNFFSEPHQAFKIIKDELFPEKRARSTLELAVRKREIIPAEDFGEIELKGLENLFSRIFALNINPQLDKYDSYTIKTLLEGIEYKLMDEFQIIMSKLYTLIIKLDKYNLVNDFNLQEDNSQDIIIEKIATVYV